jgi:hypothetical protein
MATATQEAAEQEECQETEIDTGTLKMGVFSETILIIVTIIRGEDAAIFVNINSLLIIMVGVFATGFISFPSNKPIGMVPIL